MGCEVSVICVKINQTTKHFKDGLINVFPMMESQPTQFLYYLNKIPIIKIVSGLLFYLYNGYKIHITLRRIDRTKKINFVEYSEGGDFWNSIMKTFKYSSHLHGSSYTFKNQSKFKPNIIDKIRRQMEHVFIKRAYIVVSPCNAMVKLVEKEMRFKIKNSHIIPYPISLSQIPVIQFCQSSKKVTLLFASRNDPIKGGELFIRALNKLPKSIQSIIEVKFYGYVSYQNLSNLPFIEINEFVPRDVLEKAYENADICVIPSLFDNSPNTVYEAMAHGKILIASAVGGIPEILGGNENGYLFNPNDINDFTEKIISAINAIINGQGYKMMANAQQRIMSISDVSVNAIKRLELFNS